MNILPPYQEYFNYRTQYDSILIIELNMIQSPHCKNIFNI